MGCWHSSMRVIADFMSIFSGTYLGSCCYRTWFSAATPTISTISMLHMETVIAALAAFFLCLLDAHSAEHSPLNIVESERLIRSAVSVLAIVGAYTWVLERDAALLLIAGLFVLCTFLSQRKLSSSVKQSKRTMQVRPRVAMFGSKYDAVSLAARLIADHCDWNWIGNITKKPGPELVSADVPRSTLGFWDDLDHLVAEHGITDVVVAESETTSSEVQDILHDCIRCNLGLSVLADRCFAPPYSAQSVILAGVPAWRYLAHAEPHPIGSFVKRALDVLLSTSLLIVLSPLLLLLSALVAVDSPGPIFFRHQRIGKHGRAFAMWKFRSMNTNAPVYERSPRDDSDPRLTRIGRIIRRFSLDELPQLWNVIKGDMSLVGPRPEMPFIVDQYGPLERLRLQALPGMTGLWQISPARAMPIHAHMEFDLYYIAKQSFFLDLAILFRTFSAVFRGMQPCSEESLSGVVEFSKDQVNAQ
jgi:exopolysaccharide biosynthesis polyprenyl glycosylphosphotransferase